MTVFDIVVLVVIAVSTLVSLLRGLVREVIGLVSWVAAGWLGVVWAPAMAGFLPDGIPDGPWRVLLAFLGVFLLLLILFALAGIAIGELVRSLGLSSVDRSLGLVFGFLRGVLIVCLIVFAAGFTELPREAFWRDAALSGAFQDLVLSARGWLPAEMAVKLRY